MLTEFISPGPGPGDSLIFIMKQCFIVALGNTTGDYESEGKICVKVYCEDSRKGTQLRRIAADSEGN